MISKGKIEKIEEIVSCLKDCRLFDSYFSDELYTSNFITESIEKDELYVYTNETEKIVGFVRIDLFGMLSKFPLLRVIAINPDFRGMGYGSKLLKFYEELGFRKSEKIFLCVSDFNTGARTLYEQNGYEQVGKISGIYKDGIDEFIMMKRKISNR